MTYGSVLQKGYLPAFGLIQSWSKGWKTAENGGGMGGGGGGN